MKPTLQLRVSQQLSLTPQLQQSIKLLQLSTLELNEEIERMLLENPMLEREEELEPTPPSLEELPEPAYEASEASSETRDDFDVAVDSAMPETISDAFESASNDELGETADWLSELGTGGAGGEDDNDFQDTQSASTSLHEHLSSQINLMQLTDRDRALALFVIQALDDDGYLSQKLEELLVMIPEEWEVELEELQIALHHIQNLDPLGIGARDPKECLTLQLRALPKDAQRELALRIVTEALELLASRDFLRLRRYLGCSEEALRGAHELICSLDPRPGSAFSQTETRYVVPDVLVKKVRGVWNVQLNSDVIPKLRVHGVYADMLQKNRGISTNLSGQLQEARWLIKNVQQRFDTILRVSQAIVRWQSKFFDYGEIAMQPLTLRQIADELELHESTVSRVTTNKYMSTAQGIFELKYFFGSHVSTDTGGECSATAIRAQIRQIVDGEDKKKPLSDAKIVEMLGQQGIVVARRTIAKYREALNIPPVSQRKSI